MDAIIRQAVAADTDALWRVRYAVRENTLTPGLISDEDLRRELEDTGRGWVAEVDGQVMAFVIGNASTASIWALFVHPDAQGRGYGSVLLDTVTQWLWSCGLQRLWLTTGTGTRAEDFYRDKGWNGVGITDKGERVFELFRPG
jgi:GNAT superfamily N-acetyltransferase